MSRQLIFLAAVAALVSSTGAQIAGEGYYGDGRDDLSDLDTGFSVPEYSSQSELVTKLVAPFLFVSFLLRLALMRALRLAFARDQDDRIHLLFGEEQRVDVSSEATIMSVAITAMMIPTPAWDMVTVLGQLIGVLPMLIVLGFMAFVGYLVFA